MKRRPLALASLGLSMLLVLPACGSSSTTASSSTAPGGSTAAANGAQTRDQIQECLAKAGVSAPTPPANGNGTPPTAMPSAGAGGNPADNAEVQAALKACGITMPTGTPPTGAPPNGTGPGGTPPTGTPGNASQAGNTA
ncbi:hypothetical protein [Frankia sp. Cr2]|uniref:hypothetical protein n=1 Tax=Frankia sp. Cr2 TaxID=3073932 RepID=UPI002AD50DD1|nr:hypothetical protein [Frankia sp. Cr2]